MTSPAQLLEDVYARLPELECKRLCAVSCHKVPVADLELVAIRRATGRLLPHTQALMGPAKLLGAGNDACPALSGTTCTIYDVRPLFCRLYGLVKKLRCPHGCVPARWVSDVEAIELMAMLGMA